MVYPSYRASYRIGVLREFYEQYSECEHHIRIPDWHYNDYYDMGIL